MMLCSPLANEHSLSILRPVNHSVYTCPWPYYYFKNTEYYSILCKFIYFKGEIWPSFLTCSNIDVIVIHAIYIIAVGSNKMCCCTCPLYSGIYWQWKLLVFSTVVIVCDKWRKNEWHDTMLSAFTLPVDWCLCVPIHSVAICNVTCGLCLCKL